MTKSLCPDKQFIQPFSRGYVWCTPGLSARTSPVQFYINDLFLFIKQATLYNYADDNTLSYFYRNMSDLVNTLQKETGIALSWLEQNEMIANPEKFHAIILRKKQDKY